MALVALVLAVMALAMVLPYRPYELRGLLRNLWYLLRRAGCGGERGTLASGNSAVDRRDRHA